MIRSWDSEVFQRALSWGGPQDIDPPLNEGDRIVGVKTLKDSYGYWWVRVWIESGETATETSEV